MKYEHALAKYIVDAKYEDLTDEDVDIVKKQILAYSTGLIAGWNSSACEAIANMQKQLGGREEATVFIWNGKIPAQNAAFVNSVMGRALDICDHISPGVHIGSALIPAALAVAELSGGCSGKELVLAIAVGTEVALRLNLSESCYDGFDPTGVDAVFAAAAAAAKLMRLDEKQTLHTLALAFNRCSGSFQSNIDGALAVKVIEGWTAQAGVDCARLASAGVTGPENFLSGVYGYFHIFGRDRTSAADAFEDLGQKTRLRQLSFKKYPSCGMTQGATELTIEMMRTHSFRAEDVKRFTVGITPYAAKLVGKVFVYGDNPKVDAQFNAGYCVANAAIRPPVVLRHFEPEYIADQAVLEFLKEHVTVISDESLNAYGHYTTKLSAELKDGRKFENTISIIPGIPGNALKPEDFDRRFADSLAFGGRRDLMKRSEEIYQTILCFETLDSIEQYISLFRGEE